MIRNSTCVTIYIRVKVKNSLSLLGVPFSIRSFSTAMNLNDKIRKMEEQFRIWTKRDLTLIGKILIAKSMGLSNIIYLMRNTNVPKPKLLEIQNKINKFIWNYNP